MIGFRIGKLRSLGLDTKKIERSARQAEARTLKRFGYRVRRAARQSIRKRKKTSQAGQAPSSHAGLLKRFILYAYERARRSVVIGPKRLGGKRGQAPEALEHGGRSVSSDKQPRAIKIKPRPYMGPVFEREKPKLPAMWRNSIR